MHIAHSPIPRKYVIIEYKILFENLSLKWFDDHQGKNVHTHTQTHSMTHFIIHYDAYILITYEMQTQTNYEKERKIYIKYAIHN